MTVIMCHKIESQLPVAAKDDGKKWRRRSTAKAASEGGEEGEVGQKNQNERAHIRSHVLPGYGHMNNKIIHVKV